VEAQVLTLGHSPDPDDAFMFFALTRRKIDTGPYRFQHELQDIETLNQRARREELDLTAVSLHAYAYLAEKYALLPCGASVGRGYGPIVVTRRWTDQEALADLKFAVPGTLTTAFLTLKLLLQGREFAYEVVPFDRILEAVESGQADAGLIIHEGQLTYRDHRLSNAIDLGRWWLEETGLPLPLGVNIARRSLGPETIADVTRLLRESIDYALTHREEALQYALGWGRGLDPGRGDRFVGMYVNDYTRDLGEEGRKAVATLFQRAHEAGLIPNVPPTD